MAATEADGGTHGAACAATKAASCSAHGGSAASASHVLSLHGNTSHLIRYSVPPLRAEVRLSLIHI